jgi:hypothetical protein
MGRLSGEGGQLGKQTVWIGDSSRLNSREFRFRVSWEGDEEKSLNIDYQSFSRNL